MDNRYVKVFDCGKKLARRRNDVRSGFVLRHLCGAKRSEWKLDPIAIRAGRQPNEVEGGGIIPRNKVIYTYTKRDSKVYARPTRVRTTAVATVVVPGDTE